LERVRYKQLPPFLADVLRNIITHVVLTSRSFEMCPTVPLIPQLAHWNLSDPPEALRPTDQHVGVEPPRLVRLHSQHADYLMMISPAGIGPPAFQTTTPFWPFPPGQAHSGRCVARAVEKPNTRVPTDFFKTAGTLPCERCKNVPLITRKDFRISAPNHVACQNYTI